jgi:O-antigen/teichoic acid export membrane protein
MGLGRTMLLPVVQVLFLVPFVVLNALLIPSYGALGAGISLGASTLLSGLVAYLLVQRVSGTWVLDWSSVFAPLSGGLLFAPMTLIQTPGGPFKWVPFAIWITAALLWSVHVLRGARVLRVSLRS